MKCLELYDITMSYEHRDKTNELRQIFETSLVVTWIHSALSPTRLVKCKIIKNSSGGGTLLDASLRDLTLGLVGEISKTGCICML